MSNNPPEVVIGLSRADAEFVLRNCEANIITGLTLLQTDLSRENAESIVKMNDHFKRIKDATKEALS